MEEDAELGNYATPGNINKAINFLRSVGGAVALGTPLTLKAITAQLAKQRVAGDVLGKTLGTIAGIEDVIEKPAPIVTTAVAPPSILSRPEPAVTTAVAPPSILAPAPTYTAPAPVYSAPSPHGGGGGGGGGGGYSAPGGGGYGPWRAKGGLIRKQYGSGGIVDLL